MLGVAGLLYCTAFGLIVHSLIQQIYYWLRYGSWIDRDLIWYLNYVTEIPRSGINLGRTEISRAPTIMLNAATCNPAS